MQAIRGDRNARARRDSRPRRGKAPRTIVSQIPPQRDLRKPAYGPGGHGWTTTWFKPAMNSVPPSGLIDICTLLTGKKSAGGGSMPGSSTAIGGPSAVQGPPLAFAVEYACSVLERLNANARLPAGLMVYARVSAGCVHSSE